jgi:Fe-S-cluster-containing dehydrogenase component/CRP-like cAMP-binding protein
MRATAVRDLGEINWENDLEPLLKEFQQPKSKFNPRDLEEFLHEEYPAKGIHFYKIAYDPGEIIMAKGMRSDYAAIHISGRINGSKQPVREGELGPLPSCWDKPGPLVRGLEEWVLDRTIRDPSKFHKYFRERIGARRYGFVSRKIARILRRLGISRRRRELDLYRPGHEPGRSASWPALKVDFTIPSPAPATPLTERFLGVTSAVWNEQRSATLQAADEEVVLILVKRLALLKIVEKAPEFYNGKVREFLEQTLPMRLSQNRLFRGVAKSELDAARDEILGSVDENQSYSLIVRYPKDPWKRQVKKSAPTDELMEIYKAGDAADALYLIMSGQVRVSRQAHDGPMILNHLTSDGYFGEACIVEGGLRTATVTAVGPVNLLRIDRTVVAKFMNRDKYPQIAANLAEAREHTLTRDQSLQAGLRLPPPNPSAEIAFKIVSTQNILLIDMDLCTRCDQCVRGCADAHDGLPRFHRANPEYRFGKWEVAAACFHCKEAPCQWACPVGAITLLDDGAVQIHRNRCIGCTACEKACPFDVITMLPPIHPEEAASMREDKQAIATKCDLCLSSDRAPPCVVSCPYDAARRGNPLDLFPHLKGWATPAEASLTALPSTASVQRSTTSR